MTSKVHSVKNKHKTLQLCNFLKRKFPALTFIFFITSIVIGQQFTEAFIVIEVLISLKIVLFDYSESNCHPPFPGVSVSVFCPVFEGHQATSVVIFPHIPTGSVTALTRTNHSCLSGMRATTAASKLTEALGVFQSLTETT